jgi:hypothetical protein
MWGYDPHSVKRRASVGLGSFSGRGSRPPSPTIQTGGSMWGYDPHSVKRRASVGLGSFSGRGSRPPSPTINTGGSMWGPTRTGSQSRSVEYASLSARD